MSQDADAFITIDRPVAEVFAFVADGTNDTRWRTDLLEISASGDPALGTRYTSTVKEPDGSVREREYEYSEFEAPTRIRWKELSGSHLVSLQGGYDLDPEGSGTRLGFHHRPAGSGFGKFLANPGIRSAGADSAKLLEALKAAVES